MKINIINKYNHNEKIIFNIWTFFVTISFAQRTYIFNTDNMEYEFTVIYGDTTENDRIMYSVRKNNTLYAVGNVPTENSTEPGFIRFEKISVDKEGVIILELRSYNEYQFKITKRGISSLCTEIITKPDPNVSIKCLIPPCPIATREIEKIIPCNVRVPLNIIGKTLGN